LPESSFLPGRLRPQVSEKAGTHAAAGLRTEMNFDRSLLLLLLSELL
jgi:hypothetical protein